MAKKDEVEEKFNASDEAKTLGVKISRVRLAGFKDKDPGKLAKERDRHEKLVTERTKNRIAKAKANAKKKPIEKRRELLIGRLRAVKSKTRANTYSDKNLKAWIEELEMIDRNPKSWNKITENGKKNYTPGSKKKKTAKDILDGMDLE